MSDYRRFVAYLYEYPDNRKGKNCGFVRVESRNGFCRMNFQLKLPGYSPEEKLPVYAFFRKDSRLYGIPLGELVPGRAGISGHIFTRSDRVGDTLHDLGSIAGLILISPKGRVFATQWDDIPIQPQFFEPLPQEPATEPSAAVPEDAAVPEAPELPETFSDPEASNIRKVPSDPGAPNTRKVSSDPEASNTRKIPSDPEAPSARKVFSDPEATKLPETSSTPKASTASKVSSDPGVPKLPETSSDPEFPNPFGQPKQSDFPDGTKPRTAAAASSDPRPNASMKTAPASSSRPSASPELPGELIASEAAPLEDLPETPADSASPAAAVPVFWTRLQDLLPHCLPFPDDELTDCLRATTRDLPLLRQQGCMIETSQFLNRGLQAYGHLLLARVREHPATFVLCVPGVYTANDQFMASLSGYTRFKQASRPAHRTPETRCGYWCKTLPVSQ